MLVNEFVAIALWYTVELQEIKQAWMHEICCSVVFFTHMKLCANANRWAF